MGVRLSISMKYYDIKHEKSGKEADNDDDDEDRIITIKMLAAYGF